MHDYTTVVAKALDRADKNTDILTLLLELDDNNQILIPPKAYVFIDRYRLSLGELMTPIKRKRVDKVINDNVYPFFIDEPSSKTVMRKIFKSKNRAALKAIEKGHLECRKSGYKIPDIEESNWLGKKQWDWEMGNELGLFASEDGRWQETQFQQLYAFIEAQNQKSMQSSFQLLRLYANDHIDKDNNLLPERSIAWRWLLSPSIQEAIPRAIAGRALSLFLDRKVGDTISSSELLTIEKIGEWMTNEPSNKWLWVIETLALTATANTPVKKIITWSSMLLGNPNGSINWRRIEAGIYFIKHNIKRAPEPSLLKDWLDGEVNIDGIGKVRCEQQGIWEASNVNAYFSNKNQDAV